MGKIRQEKRKLARLSNKPAFIKSYNHKVRKQNQKVCKKRKEDRFFEYKVFLGILITFCTILGLKLWLKV
jgi:hypothetical protein